MNIKKNIKLCSTEVSYTIKKNKRSRNMRIAISSNGELSVTIPTYVYSGIVERHLKEREEWILKSIETIKKRQNSFCIKNTKANFEKYKELAREKVEIAISKYNKIYNFSFNKISIKNQKTRWGSCSKKGNLNFNYRLALLPDRLVEYVVVHELCHLKEFNHSARFWSLVALGLPGYKTTRKDLKKFGLN